MNEKELPPIWFMILSVIILFAVGAIIYLGMRVVTHLFSADYVIALYFTYKILNYIMEKIPNE